KAGSDGLPYRYADPQQDKPAPGDLLCFLRGRKQPLGASGLREALARGGARPWESHCDIVVAANVGGDHTLYLIGGNVLNAVTMRKLPLDRAGRLQLQAPLAQDQVGDDGAGLECTPGREELCDFNRQDWAALLQLQPQAQLRPLALPGVVPAVKPAALPAAAPMAPAPASGTAPAAARRHPCRNRKRPNRCRSASVLSSACDLQHPCRFASGHRSQ
ncbi:DUF2272 domain-containing protein, partial [Xanthomonas translucens]|uniref:DUF2272 domain-containing protein n=1 Tax=Xanthomonas campestris pv. translucens TaxID=343 RepID=UPI000AFACBC7